MTKMKQASMVGGPNDGKTYELPEDWQVLVIAEYAAQSFSFTENIDPSEEVPVNRFAIPIVKRNGKLFLDYYSKVPA